MTAAPLHRLSAASSAGATTGRGPIPGTITILQYMRAVMENYITTTPCKQENYARKDGGCPMPGIGTGLLATWILYRSTADLKASTRWPADTGMFSELTWRGVETASGGLRQEPVTGLYGTRIRNASTVLTTGPCR